MMMMMHCLNSVCMATVTYNYDVLNSLEYFTTYLTFTLGSGQLKHTASPLLTTLLHALSLEYSDSNHTTLTQYNSPHTPGAANWASHRSGPQR